MASKYDEAWINIYAKYGGLMALLDRVRSGELVAMQVNDLLRYGNRSTWNGKVVLSNEGIIGSKSGAHVNALKNIMCKHILPDERIECSVRTKDSRLMLYMRSYATGPLEQPVSVQPILTPKELGDFYILVSSFERDLRNYIRKKIGKGYIKRLKHNLPQVVDEWEKRKEIDRRWGIEPEQETINYALLPDYMQIIKKYRRIFSRNEEELNLILAHLKIFANQGRNPLMHCRTLTLQKYYATKAAVDFLEERIKN